MARERELVKPPPSLAGLEEISPAALLAMAIAGTVAILDGALGPMVVLMGLLAIPPVVAAISTSLPETAIVGAVCVLLALLSGLWNENLAETDYAVELLIVSAGAVAGLWLASLRVDLDREQQASELLGEAGALMESALDQRERAEHLAELAVPALGDVAMVDMLDDEGSIVRMAARSREPGLAEAFTRLRAETPIPADGPHPVAEVIRSGEAIALGRLSDREIDEITTGDEARAALRRHRFQYCLVLPLRARGSILGALTLWIMRSANAFDRIARRTAERLTERAALGLDNARLHERQAHVAQVLQQSLRPRSLPAIQGFELASRFLAAGEAYEVGGDFYDAFRTGSRSWSIVIGDVCGKGPEAAALTALARYTIRTASTPRTGPSAVLRVLHESISAEQAEMRFCTAALLRVSQPANGTGAARLTVSLGGHPPPLALRRDGDVEAVGVPGSLLGAFPDPALSDAGTELAPGEALVLYTDGILDARDRGRGDERAWLAAQAASTAGGSPEEIAEKLTRAAVKRHGGEPRDDIAVIVLRRMGP